MADFEVNTRHGPEDYNNAADLNRIEGTTKFLADLLVEYGYGGYVQPRAEVPEAVYPIPAFDEQTGELTGDIAGEVIVPAHTNWTVYDIPSISDCNRILNNIRLLMKVYCVLPTTPPLPESMQFLGWQQANDIEQILADMYLLIQWMVNCFHYANQFYSGEHVDLAGIRFVTRRTMGELDQYTMDQLEERTMQELMYGW